MTTTTKPAGLLLTGAIGSFILAAALLIAQFMGGQGGLIAGLLLMAGHVTVALGFGGWGKLHGGMSMATTIFAWIAAISMLAGVLLVMSQVAFGLLLAATVAPIAVGLTALFAGLTLMGSGNAVNGQLAKIGGILLIVAGAVMTAMIVLAFAGIGLPGFLSYVSLAAGVAGWVLAGVVFLSEKG